MTTTTLDPDGATPLALPNGSLRIKDAGPPHFVVEIVADPGFAPTPHVHHHDEELFYVLEGTFEFLVNDAVVDAPAGTFVAVPPGTVHDFRNSGPRTARLLGIATPGDGFADYFTELSRQWTTARLSGESLAALRVDARTASAEVTWPPT